MNPRVACIGSREISTETKVYLEYVGLYYASRGCTIVTGNAQGSDQAYALGANTVDPNLVELWLPWPSYEQKAVLEGNTIHLVDEATRADWVLAERCHPAWAKLNDPVRRLMVRNAMIVSTSQLVVAWPDRSKIGYGGTGHGMRVAMELGISIWFADAAQFYGA